MSSGKPYDELETIEAQHIKKNYVCSSCWGELTIQRSDKGERLFKVVCCGECGEGQGFVSRDYAERRRNDDHWDAHEAKENLGKALGLIPDTTAKPEKIINQIWP